MALTITHSKISSKGTGSDPSVIYGPDWNALHVLNGNVLASEVVVTPTGGIVATTSQGALAGLDTLKANIADLASLAFSGVGGNLSTNLVAWTPVLTCATPGDLAVTYSAQSGKWAQISNHLIWVQFVITCSAFTYTTASGTLQITGLPFTSPNTPSQVMRGALTWGGINKAGYTQVALGMPVNSAFLGMNASGMGQNVSSVAITDLPSPGTPNFAGEIIIVI